MAITSRAEMERALQSRFSMLYISKTAINPTNAGAGFNISYWQTSGTPGAGFTSTTAATLNHSSTGALNFMQQTSPLTSYLVDLNFSCTGVAGHTLEIHDRLVNIGGLNGNITTLQTITGLDLNLFLSTDNIGNRIGDSNYSDVQWWLEILSDGGSTTATVSVGVTYNDGSSGTLAVPTVSFRRQARIISINNYIPAVDSGKYIRAVNTVQLSAGSGDTSNFAVVATRYRASIYMDVTNKVFNRGWTELGLPEIYNQSCLFPIIIAPSTSIGNIRIYGTIAHG
jgi:hypothetical protein